MGTEWYPVNPALTDTGLLAALANLPHPERFRPLKDDAPEGSRFKLRNIEDKSEDASVLASLGVVGILDAKASYSTHIVYRDVIAGHEVTGQASPDSLVRGTLWGAGFRLTLVVSSLETDLKVDTPFAAVATELGIASTSFEIQAYGLVNASVLKDVPTAGRFDSDAYAALRTAEEKIRKYMDTNGAELQAVPLALFLTEFPVTGAFDEAQATLFAVSRIETESPLGETIEAAGPLGLHLPTIKRVHHHFTGNQNLTAPIQRNARRSAWEWLKKSGD